MSQSTLDIILGVDEGGSYIEWFLYRVVPISRVDFIMIFDAFWTEWEGDTPF